MSTISYPRTSNIVPSVNASVKENANPNVAISGDAKTKPNNAAHEAVSGLVGRPSLPVSRRSLLPHPPSKLAPAQVSAPPKRAPAPSRFAGKIQVQTPFRSKPSSGPLTTTVSKLSNHTASGRASVNRASGSFLKLPGQAIAANLKDLMESAQKLSTQVDQISSRLYDKDAQLEVVSKEKPNPQGRANPYEKQMHKTKCFLDRLEQELWGLKCRHKAELDGLQSALNSTQSSLLSSKEALKKKEECLKQKDEFIDDMNVKLHRMLEQNSNLQNSVVKLEEESHRLSSIVMTQEAQIKELEAQLLEDEQIRRQMHNTIQELKGNIRVYCRVRGLLPEEKMPSSKDDAIYYVFNKFDCTSFEIVQKQQKDVTGCKAVPDKRHFFKFDYVFQSNSTQKSVFSEISQLVQSALDGYHACIFAYGQTGSGKTYTMEGPEGSMLNEETEGMISRAVKQIFESSDKLRGRGWCFEIHASFLEIYNENIRDLLDPKNSGTKKCDVKHEASTGQTSVSNLLVVQVKTPDQVYELLRTASKNRMVGATRLNLHSSRSHCVFQLRIVGKNEVTGNAINGLLNMIDLAGSERVAASGATGDRFTETKYINKSLCCLKNVIAALANKDKHVPFRDSKLTYLLQNSLGGQSKTLMFVNISPSPENFNETINSLRFASQVNACEIGTAKKVARVDLSD
ncbi:carboxy-terminal kinesin 2 isoform X2 [Schistocerca gregaria]|uniref:carboxy-terminal kinesin 2 isoform X2 n=1 Tax=Schistocerca gregaria TaxID=7010 RepID=UPI00211E3E70|nr:carboxy-terminal kinesin 2 isoform X2 [Schistocerca gregaria]